MSTTALRSLSTSSTSSRGSASSNRPQLKLTTHNLADDEITSPNKPANRYYAHLLYVDTPQRERIMARSISSASSNRSRASSTHSHAASYTTATSTSSNPNTKLKPPVTPSAKSILTPITTPTYVDEHYPLITTINPDTVPSHIPRTHPAFHCASHMAQIHNLVIRALNSIYNQCLQPTSPSDTATFLHYCRIFCSLLDHHHEIEDTWLFPEFERLLAQPGSMGVNVAGHDAFLPGLQLFEAYVTKTRPEEYCGMTLRNMLDRFAPLLVEHLHEEIPTMLMMWRVDAKELEKCWAVAEKMGRSGGSVWEAPAFIMACVDKEMVMDGEPCSFPGAPAAVEWVVRKGLARRFAGVWKWAPFSFEGERRLVRA